MVRTSSNTNDYVYYPNDSLQVASTIDVYLMYVSLFNGFLRHQDENDNLVPNRCSTGPHWGSTMKPITDYAPVLLKFIQTLFDYYDNPYNFPGSFSHLTTGTVSDMEAFTDFCAIQQSRNVTAVKALRCWVDYASVLLLKI